MRICQKIRHLEDLDSRARVARDLLRMRRGPRLAEREPQDGAGQREVDATGQSGADAVLHFREALLAAMVGTPSLEESFGR